MPFLLGGLVTGLLGVGLMLKFTPSSGPGEWVTFQLLAGIGLGFGLQQPMVAAQVVLKADDVPIGTSIMIFFQTLGGALFISVAQSVFTNKFAEGLRGIEGLDVERTLRTGATLLKDTVPEGLLGRVVEAYNAALVQCFYPALAMLGVALVCAGGMEWVSVKGKKLEGAGAA